MYVWAVKKHRRYRKEFGDKYPKGRKGAHLRLGSCFVGSYGFSDASCAVAAMFPFIA